MSNPTQELFSAVCRQYTRPERVSELVQAGAQVNASMADGTTILMNAVQYSCNSKVIDELLKAGADVNAVNEYGQNVLMRAALYNPNPEIIRMLLNAGTDVNSCDKHGNTILMMASSRNNNPFVIMELIRAGSEVNAVNQFGDTALIMSVETYFSDVYRDEDCSLEIIKILVRSGADTEIKGQEGKTAISYAYDFESEEDKNPVLEFLRWRNRVLTYADWKNITIEELRKLIYSGADVNGLIYTCFGTLTPLTEACEASHNPDVIEALITAGAKNLDSALDTAMNWDSCEAARVLLCYGADVVYSSYEDEEIGKTRLMWAAEHHSSPEMITLLIDAGAEINRSDYYGWTPLMFAAANDEYIYDSKVIETLLVHGASVKHKDDHGRTALHYACKKVDNLDTFLMLIKAGADVNAHDNEGCTPLMMACREGDCSAEVIKLLLRAGANVNASDNDGWTALFWAAANEEIWDVEEIIDVLIFAGADIHAKSKTGKKAVDYARESLNYKAAKILWELM